MSKTLLDWLPAEVSLNDVPLCVKRKARLPVIDEKPPGRWPGPHRNVHAWIIVGLPDGPRYAVGWNESPRWGWSFPVIKLKEPKK